MHTPSAIQTCTLLKAAVLIAKESDRTIKQCMNKFHSMSRHVTLSDSDTQETEGFSPSQSFQASSFIQQTDMELAV